MNTPPDPHMPNSMQPVVNAEIATPRVDAVASALTYGADSPFAAPMTTLAHQLERELGEAKAYIEGKHIDFVASEEVSNAQLVVDMTIELHECQVERDRLRDENGKQRKVLDRAGRALVAWDVFYGEQFANKDVLPPAGILIVQEDIAEALKENAQP